MVLSRFIVVSWEDKLPVSPFHHKFPQMYSNVPNVTNLKESDIINLFILSNKPYVGFLFCSSDPAHPLKWSQGLYFENFCAVVRCILMKVLSVP